MALMLRMRCWGNLKHTICLCNRWAKQKERNLARLARIRNKFNQNCRQMNKWSFFDRWFLVWQTDGLPKNVQTNRWVSLRVVWMNKKEHNLNKRQPHPKTVTIIIFQALVLLFIITYIYVYILNVVNHKMLLNELSLQRMVAIHFVSSCLNERTTIKWE